MSRAGIRLLDEDDYLSPAEREKRASAKQDQLKRRRLTPDWFTGDGELCLPPGLRVAVIGAGFAGLSAAWYLRRCGVKTTVFEASDRIGGRVRTNRSYVAGKIIEDGAELIGENHPLWGILALEFGLPLVELTDDETYKNDGLEVRTRFGSVDLTPAQKKSIKATLRPILARMGLEAVLLSETKPWEEPIISSYLDRMPVSKKFDSLFGTTRSLARSFLEFTLENDNCALVAKQSYLGLLAAISAARMGDDTRGMLGYWMSTETHRCGGGNDLLADRLSKGLPDLRLRTAVDSVQIEPAFLPPVRILSSTRDAAGKVIQTRSEDYDFAVLAIPPSVWDKLKVTPYLNPASRTIQHGPAVKFLSRCDTRFWKAAKLAPSAKWNEMGSLWEGTDKQAATPEFALSVFSGGPFVFAKADYPKKVATLYPTGTPKDNRFIDWPTMPFIETGYAVPGPGQVTTISPAQLTPHKDRLYFAGEQTSTGFFGYMEGALQSGARAARDIVERMAFTCGEESMTASVGGGAGESEEG